MRLFGFQWIGCVGFSGLGIFGFLRIWCFRFSMNLDVVLSTDLDTIFSMDLVLLVFVGSGSVLDVCFVADVKLQKEMNFRKLLR